MNALSSFDKTDSEHWIAHTEDLVRFWRSKVKIAPWLKYVVARAFTLSRRNCRLV